MDWGSPEWHKAVKESQRQWSVLAKSVEEMAETILADGPSSISKVDLGDARVSTNRDAHRPDVMIVYIDIRPPGMNRHTYQNLCFYLTQKEIESDEIAAIIDGRLAEAIMDMYEFWVSLFDR